MLSILQKLNSISSNFNSRTNIVILVHESINRRNSFNINLTAFAQILLADFSKATPSINSEKLCRFLKSISFICADREIANCCFIRCFQNLSSRNIYLFACPSGFARSRFSRQVPNNCYTINFNSAPLFFFYHIFFVVINVFLLLK